jgi:hypothetical protein
VDVTYKDAAGARAGVLLFRSREAELEIVVEGRPWSFDSDANAFKLAAEAKRISLGYLFDPYLAVATADIRDQSMPSLASASTANGLTTFGSVPAE